MSDKTIYIRGDWWDMAGKGKKYHILYDRSRTHAWTGVANCGQTRMILKEGFEPPADEICKKCLRGPTPFVKETFKKIRVKP